MQLKYSVLSLFLCQTEITGSFRRGKENSGDIDIIISLPNCAAVDMGEALSNRSCSEGSMHAQMEKIKGIFVAIMGRLAQRLFTQMVRLCTHRSVLWRVVRKCVPPYTRRKVVEVLFTRMALCEIMEGRSSRGLSP